MSRTSRVAAGLVVTTWIAAGSVPRAQFSTSLDLVEVYATVTDREGIPITGLSQADFEIQEDGQPQDISVFTAGDIPLSLAIGLDRSWSMAGDRLARAKRAGATFVQGLRATDLVMVLAIGSQVETIAPLADDRAGQLAAIQSLDPWGTTPLHDAVIAAIDQIQSARGRRALILLSDGDERYSEATASAAFEHARRADVLIYPIALGRTRPALFVELAVLSGGRSFHARDAERLDEALGEIGQELRHQYLLGYTPARPVEPGEDAWRSIRVAVRSEGAQVRARDGYFVR